MNQNYYQMNLVDLNGSMIDYYILENMKKVTILSVYQIEIQLVKRNS